MSIPKGLSKREHARWFRAVHIVTLLLALGTVGCAEPVVPERLLSERREVGPPPPGIDSIDVHDLTDAVRVERTLAVIPYEQLWHRPSAIQPRDYPQDSAGVPLYDYRGHVTYHPVVIEWKAVAFLNNYDDTGDTSALGLAERMAERLILEAHEVDGALYLPYQFDFDMHGIPGETLFAPWYSGLAQGMALTLFTRLHRATGKAHYLEDAERVFESFLRARREHAAIARLDSANYYWIEEYPMEPKVAVLNGFITALLGLHEYWQATGDPRAESTIMAGLATLEHHIEAWRVPGEASYYCLRYMHQIPNYHYQHVWLLQDLARATNSPLLLEAAATYRGDFWL